MSNYSQLQKTVKVFVDFYDDAEREKLLKYSSKEDIIKIVPSTIEIPTSEFLTYYLFRNKRYFSKKYSHYNVIGRYIKKAFDEIDEFVTFNGQSLNTNLELDKQDPHKSEFIGESVGLSTISRIHNCIEADWIPIPTKGGRGGAPTFDYQYYLASTGEEFIQVECKGTAEENNSLKGKASKHKLDILEKKSDLEKLAKSNGDPFPASTRYGTITSIDPRKDSILKCWVTDPDSQRIKENPYRLKLLTRMKFLRDWIAFISPRSSFSTSVNTRIGCLENIQDPQELDKIPLKKINGESFELIPKNARSNEYSFFTNKSNVEDGSSFGHVLKLSENELFFIGIREEFFILASKQNFEKIMTFRYPSDSIEKIIECVFRVNRFKELNLPDNKLPHFNESKEHVRFSLKGQIHYSTSGLVFGVLPVLQK